MIDRPARAYLPSALETGRVWGLAVNLYATRSQRNWGIGDFTDLEAVIALAHDAGAGLVGVNPLHALHHGSPEAASPYSPSSRRFLNALYVDVERTPEYASAHPSAAKLRERVAAGPLAETIADLRASNVVDYARVARVKYSALETCYDVLRTERGERLAAFFAFAHDGGDALETFALYEALRIHFARTQRAYGWLAWPEDFRDARGENVRAWATQHRRRVDYFKYLQWIARAQLDAASAAADALAVGLYLDLAVGVDLDAADVWSQPDAYVLDETVGAPPDPLGPLGQNWGLPAPNPQALLNERGGLASLLAEAMRFAGALRLDHAMALLRLYRIPRGKTATEGGYIDYPFEDLLAIVARESHRNCCAIVGEDLGNVPPGFRERMDREAILSYRVLLFERTPDGGYVAPEEYPVLALATATTHDSPTLLGWIAARDVAIRERLGDFDAEVANAARVERGVDALRLVERFERSDVLRPGDANEIRSALARGAESSPAYAHFVRAAYAYLAQTPAKLVVVALDDALGERDPVNVPGTSTEYPNWRRKQTRAIETVAGDDDFRALAQTMNAALGRNA